MENILSTVFVKKRGKNYRKIFQHLIRNMKELIERLIESQNSIEISAILKKYGIKFRSDYISIIGSLIDKFSDQQKMINKLQQHENKDSLVIVLYLKDSKNEELEVI